MDSEKKNPLLGARNITKNFPGVRALDGVTFDAFPGEIHALVGENGAGKSTLIKILAGVYPYDSYEGEVVFKSQPVTFRTIRDSKALGIAVIHQELALVKHMTVGENILLGDEPHYWGIIDYDRLYSEAEDTMKQLGVTVDVRTEIVNLGVGEQQLVEIAKAVRKKANVLILDEPTAALAEHEIEVLMGIMRRLKEQGTALIYISHKIDEVFSIADRITVLRDGQTVANNTVKNWTREGVVRAMVGRELTDMFPKVEHQPGKVIFEVEGLSLEDPEVPGRMLFKNVSFDLREREILGIAGLMGAGRTELLSAIFGIMSGNQTGRILIEEEEVQINSPYDAIRAGMALIPEDRKNHGLNLIFSVLYNLSIVHLDEFCKFGIVDTQQEFIETEGMVRELNIKIPSLGVAVETLSGGNQQKVVLGKWLLRRPRILFMDEPTRGIDVGAKSEIHRLIGELTRQGMAVVMVSSELSEILGVADRILVLRQGCVSGRFSRQDATPDKIMGVAT